MTKTLDQNAIQRGARVWDVCGTAGWDQKETVGELKKIFAEGEVAIDVTDNLGQTALMRASYRGQEEVVKFLLEKNANPNLQDEHGWAAIMCGYEKVVEQILKQKIEIDLRDKSGATAVMRAAAFYGSEAVLKLLLDQKANPNLQDENGETALMRACEGVHQNKVQMLIDAGADLDLRDKDGNTALMIACKLGRKDVVKALLNAGAKVDIADNSGQTAIQKVYEGDHHELVDILLEHGANEFDLKLCQPEYRYLRDQTDPKNISNDGGVWHEIAEVMILAVRNRDRKEFPFMQKNGDGSVSLFLSDETFEPKYLDENFREKMKSEDVPQQLQYQAHEHGAKIIGDGNLLEIKVHEDTNLTEYKFNISAENLDSIMMKNHYYLGYRSENSLLKLTKNFTMKDGVIRLFPALISEDKIFVQAAGCQVFEMPTVQLLHALPDYESEILPRHRQEGNSFHWMPKEVEEALHLDRDNFAKILDSVFSSNGISSTFAKSDDDASIDLAISDPSKLHSIAMVKMDEEAKTFYAMCGNISVEDLEGCLSVEVDLIELLASIRGNLESDKSADLTVIDRMIEIEMVKKKSVAPSSAPIPTAVDRVANDEHVR